LGGSQAAGERGAGATTQPPRAQRPAVSPETAPSLHQTVVPDPTKPAHIPRKLSASEMNTALAHFYRGEITRANTWRNRLDTTTNWAVLTSGATLSFAFSSPTNPHFVILINSLLVAFFLFMEARRYRYYEIWSSRVRVLEIGYFARLFAPDAPAPDDSWAAQLSEDLVTPHFTISEWEAVGRRLRRNYLWLFALLAASWNLKVYLHPLPAYDFNAFIDRARVGVVPGEIVFMVGIVFNLTVVIFALATVRLREATGEVLPQHDFSGSLRRMTGLARGAAKGPASAARRRAKKARERTRSAPRPGQTGEWRRSDIHRSQSPDDIHRTDFPHREHVPEETLK
jgi:uncharacterized membrane protein